MKRFTLTVHDSIPELGLEEGDVITVDPTNTAESFVLRRVLAGDFTQTCQTLQFAISDHKICDQDGAEDRPYWTLNRMLLDHYSSQDAAVSPA